MRLGDLLEGMDVGNVTGDIRVPVSGVAYDSRQVESGAVFVAIRGAEADGNDYVDEAIVRGAVAVVSEDPRRAEIPWLQVESARSALALLASNYFGRPTSRLRLVGITGTNGKTTTTYLVESILKSADQQVALMGTIDYRGPGFEHAAERTTPEAPDLERLFRSAVDAGCGYGVMEVSSHAIALERVARLDFEVAAFTNLTGDHLDFHGGMRAYFETKKRLFSGLAGRAPRWGVINRDDDTFEELRDSGPEGILSYGLNSNADIHPHSFCFDEQGSDAEFETPLGRLRIRSSLMGRPNLYNLAAALGIGIALDLPTESIIAGVEALHSVPGRFELIDCGQPFRVIVDYAHTDDALENVLGAARELTRGKLVVVFGCGGDRDRTKRSRMGAVAGRLSDFAVVTSDNPRSEDPAEVIRMVEDGLREADSSRWVSHVDRQDAIRAAIEMARDKDTVVIAGKGHEDYQVIGDIRIPFDDRVVARELLDELNARRNH